MPTTYTTADPDVLSELARVMRDWHPRLAEASVRVGVLFALNPDGPAVKHGGYPALATIKVVSLRDRVGKNYDAELLIDAREWAQLRDGQRAALLDHELSHIDTVDLTDEELRELDGNGGVKWKADDLGRPKLKSVKGSWNAGDGFAEVVARHGADAIEYANLARCKSLADGARRVGERQKE